MSSPCKSIGVSEDLRKRPCYLCLSGLSISPKRYLHMTQDNIRIPNNKEYILLKIRIICFIIFRAVRSRLDQATHTGNRASNVRSPATSDIFSFSYIASSFRSISHQCWVSSFDQDLIPSGHRISGTPQLPISSHYLPSPHI